MIEATLTISGRGQTHQAELNAKGTIVGRSARCDVVIEGRDISREHARIFEDPFGRWIFEDLGSSNGIFYNGKRVEACAVLSGEPVIIGPFSLTIREPVDKQIKLDFIQGSNIVVEDFETEIFYGKGKGVDGSARPFPEHLGEISELLSELKSPASLYPAVCRHIAWAPKTAAVVLRAPGKGKGLPKTPDVLACYFGHNPEDAEAVVADGSYPNALAFRLSHRVLEEVLSNGEAAMAKSIYSSDAEITTTVVDEHSPRAVICAPLGDVTEKVDLLYVDIPIGSTAMARPEEMFEFVRAVSREIISARKNLLPMQVKAERSTLDHELSLGQELQSRLAPTVPQGIPGIDAAVRFEPVMWVGGDYCDVWPVGDGGPAFAVGKVSGNGLEAATAMSNLRAVLRTTMSFCSEPSDVMEHVNSYLIDELPKGMSVALFLGLFEAAKGTVRYVNAGGPQPFLVNPRTAVKALGEADSTALGSAGATFETNIETIQQGCELIVFTEGIIKAESRKGEQFGVRRLANLLKTTVSKSAQQRADSVVNAVMEFQQSPGRQDDITLFVLVKS